MVPAQRREALPLMRGRLADARHLTQYAHRKAETARPATEGELLEPARTRSLAALQIVEPAEPLRPLKPTETGVLATEFHVAVAVQAPLAQEARVRGALLPLEPVEQTPVYRSVDPRETGELPVERPVKTE